MTFTSASKDLLTAALAASGSRESALARETATFESIAGGASSVVVFGAGYLGNVVHRFAQNAGFKVLAFADNNPAKQGCAIDGIQVLSPAEAVSKFNGDSLFVVGVFNGSAPRDQLRQLGCRRVLPFPAFFWRFPQCFPGDPWFELPHAILEHNEPMRRGYECLSDETSKREFAAQIQWRCTLDFSCLAQPSAGTDTYYEPGLVRLIPNEVLVDCGAFDGDSIRMFLDKANHTFRHIYAVEPDPRNRAALQSSLVPLLNGKRNHLSILPYGVGSRNETASFEVTGTAGSHITEAGGGDVMSIECRRLDDILDGPPPTFIKMDIEGAEPEAIKGAAATIRNARPVMAVCAYHKCEHLWTIPALLKGTLPDYHIFLRRYAEECWELVYYAIPPERLVAGKTDKTGLWEVNTEMDYHEEKGSSK